MIIPYETAERAAITALELAGAPRPHATIQASLLLEAELRGAASHGLLRLPRIVERIAAGVIDPTVTGRHDWRAPGFLAVDGEMGLGPVVGLAALRAAMGAVDRTGVAVAAVRDNNHLGMLAWYAEQAASEGFACIVLTTSEALVHPWGGRSAMIGTNPIAIGVPTADGPFVADVATGVISMGKVHDHALRGEPLQPGWALDGQGEPTLDAEAAKAGSIAPFGGAKGYALSLAFELLVGALTSSALGGAVVGTLDSTQRCTKGDLFIVMRPAAGSGRALADYLAAIRACPPAHGFAAVRVPGDRAREEREKRLATGLTLTDSVWARLRNLADVTPRG